MKLAVRFEEQEQRLDCDFGEVHEIAGAEGYGKGYNDGKKDGYAEGYGEGESAGYSNGYDIGYEKGATESPAAMQLDALIDNSITEISSNAKKVKAYAFYLCNTIITAAFPAAVEVGSQAFYICQNLTRVDLSSAASIGTSAFSSCSKLSSLIIRSTVLCALSSATALNNTPIKSGKGYIYVPSALVDSYKTATNWATYANQFRAIEDYTVDGTLNGEMDWEKMGVAA